MRRLPAIGQAAAADANRNLLERVERENVANQAKRAGAADRQREEEQRCAFVKDPCVQAAHVEPQ